MKLKDQVDFIEFVEFLEFLGNSPLDPTLRRAFEKIKDHSHIINEHFAKRSLGEWLQLYGLQITPRPRPKSPFFRDEFAARNGPLP
jgi:hypothetical protein